MITERDKVFLGYTIKTRRYDLGLTKTDLARRLTLHPSIVGLWEDETRPVPHDRLEILAAALECNEVDLLEDARVVVNGYPIGTGYSTLPPDEHRLDVLARSRPLYRRIDILALLEAHPVPAAVKLPPSEVPLAWCNSDHGCGVCRRHHHGVLPSWAPGPMLVLYEEPNPFGGRSNPPPAARIRSRLKASA